MELNKKTREYWTEDDLKLLDKVDNLSDMYKIAIRVIDRMPKPVVQVCGPISTGGVGSIPGNIEVLNNKINELIDKGINVFDQAIFEDATGRMTEKLSKDEYFADVLTEFYFPLFKLGYINELYFLPDWQTSRGATWEHEQAQKLGIKIVYC